jgi:hypothetical protein
MTNDAYLQAVTANDRRNGDVIFLANIGGWTHSLSQAAVAKSPDDAGRLLGVAKAQESSIVEPYLIAVGREPNGGLTPVHYRERIRLVGLSNHPDFGRLEPRSTAIN